MIFLLGVMELGPALGAGPVDEAKLVPAGDLFADRVFCEFAIYILPGSTVKPDDEMGKLLAKDTLWTRAKKLPDKVDKPVLVTSVIGDGAKSYKPPSVSALQYFGRELSKEQAADVQNSPQVYVLDFVYPEKDIWKCLRAATQIAGELGVQTKGLVWDEATRELFTADSWKTRRLDTWTEEGVPDLAKQFTMHSYMDDDYVRAVTLGMSKFGLPDVAVNNFVWSDSKQVGNLINLLCQALAEGEQLKKPGEFDLDMHSIKQAEVRQRRMKDVLPGAKDIALLDLQLSKPEKGDAPNRQIKIGFDRYDGVDDHARQEAMLTSMFGAKEDVKLIRHNAEILAARDRARAKLPELRAAFLKGLAPGEYIQLKAPFKGTGGQTEWMWVEVVTWKDDAISGLLKNEPYYVPTLHAGQMVDISEKTVFDYLHIYADGHKEGNETGEIISKMEEGH